MNKLQQILKALSWISCILFLAGLTSWMVWDYYVSSDAYEYIPDTVRAAPKYTDVKMFECSWCHRVKNLNRHHIIPQSADPSLKNDYSNIIVLCRDCHFVLGHRCNWKKFNPDVVFICEHFTNTYVSADYLKNNSDIINQNLVK